MTKPQTKMIQGRNPDATEPSTRVDRQSVNAIPLSKVNKLKKRMGKRIWDGVIFNRDGIIDPILQILNNDSGRALKELLALDEIENCCHAPCICGQVRQFTL